ncbi:MULTISPECIES: hypothetical protein [Nocardiopsis]|uniref:Uncharacterized protein n=1 Tax=Nocardiopsis dassonvillei (strain ATCC 23218 / DSM 43111 / CIP 107115 / JCM 7437 / KCTC 9190 / NBRC 14626 / NCTC 10488 / NRRL B-5397 / IMRU 509) TaxID=446468 RepID=D7B0M8_NOCDD|nr:MULTISPECIES: hypothetical protein [Nocardiopsis]ADH66435.1 conserved hypothetical protein [Nocardiopsis dassonvillei subsp. dassonvillei DSM 43111]APC34748.1 hypothetical protein A9R04_08600 [Nocardiopsis dassonvillei]NKY77826.1 hypothetical protein [Nocardiopsis dassonvillei]VEI92456.1 Uncharacterised protein [Nocardiopsis dassonvillei]
MSADSPGKRKGRTASRVFDIRTIIALLFAIYGVVLTAMGFAAAPEQIEQSGTNLNLWSGLGMLAFAVFMGGWALVKPLKAPEEPGPDTGA